MKESFDIDVGNAGLLCAIASLHLFFAGTIGIQETACGKFVVTKIIEEVLFDLCIAFFMLCN